MNSCPTTEPGFPQTRALLFLRPVEETGRIARLEPVEIVIERLLRLKCRMTEPKSAPTEVVVPPRTISGKSLTIGLLGSLLVICGLVGWVSFAYADYAHAKREADRAWNEASDLLASRYKAIDVVIAAAVDAQTVDKAFGDQWRTGRDAFGGVFVQSGKVKAALELELLLKELRKSASGQSESFAVVKADEELVKRMAAYNAKAREESSSMSTPGLMLLRSVLILKEPVELELAE